MNRVRLRLLVLVATACLLPAGIARANPSHKVMDTPLAIHGKLSSAPWHAEASRLHAEAAKKLHVFLEKEEKDAIKTISAEDLGKTHLTVTMMNRGGGWMEIWGEPAGADFKRRAAIMHVHLERIIGASTRVPATQKYMDNFRQFLAKTTASRAKALANIEKLCNEKKWEAAEAALFRVYDTLEPGIVFLPPPERVPIYEPFIQVSSAIMTAMTQMRVAAATEELKSTIRELTPKYDQILQELNSALDSVAATGAATWSGESVAGPQLVERVAQTWRDAQVHAQQVRAKGWALSERGHYSGLSLDATAIPDTNASDSVAAEFTAFSQQLMNGLVRFVETDGNRATADVARKLYVEYLRAFAPLVRQTNDRQWGVKLEAALAKVLAKDPVLERESKAYAAATSEMLRWRARVAAAQASTQKKEYAPLVQRFHDGTISGKVDGANYLGLFPEPPAPDTPPQFWTASSEIMPVAIQRLVGQKAEVRDVIRIAPDSKIMVARYSSRTFANIPAPLPLGNAVEALKADLLVSEQAPPLTLSAMQAVVTAERGDMIAVGGEITGLHLEAVVTRFAALPPSAALLTPLGQLSPENVQGAVLRSALMRFEIAPRWAQHDYFFVNLAPAGNLTAGVR